MRAVTASSILGVLILLAACGGADEDTGGVTAEESRQLNEAAAMLDTLPAEGEGEGADEEWIEPEPEEAAPAAAGEQGPEQ